MPITRRPLFLFVAFALIAPVTLAVNARAQDDGPISIAAAGLTNPRGFTWLDDGTLLVAEAGVGGETTSEQEIVPPPIGPFSGGPTAAVVGGSANCPVTLASGSLPARCG